MEILNNLENHLQTIVDKRLHRKILDNQSVNRPRVRFHPFPDVNIRVRIVYHLLPYLLLKLTLHVQRPGPNVRVVNVLELRLYFVHDLVRFVVDLNVLHLRNHVLNLQIVKYIVNQVLPHLIKCKRAFIRRRRHNNLLKYLRNPLKVFLEAH